MKNMTEGELKKSVRELLKLLKEDAFARLIDMQKVNDQDYIIICLVEQDVLEKAARRYVK